MKKRKVFSITILIMFLIQLVFGMGFSEIAEAEETDSAIPKFTDVRKETLDFAYQYKNKTIVNNAVIIDNNIKLFVEENGQKHIVSEDFNLIRYLSYIGLYNGNAYVVSKQDNKQSIYRIDLNTYKMEFVKAVPVYGDGKAHITNYAIDSKGTFWFQAVENNIPIYDSTGRIIDYNAKYIVYNDKDFSYEALNLQDSNSLLDNFGQIKNGADGTIWFSKSFKLGTNNKVCSISEDNKVTEYKVSSNNQIEKVYPGADNKLFLITREIIKDINGNDNLGKTIVQQYKINNGTLEQEKEFQFSDIYFFSSMDSNGNLWMNQNGVISKLEGDEFIIKYVVSDNMNDLDVYDDKHLVTCGILGFGYTPISIDEQSENPAGNDTGTNNDSQNQIPEEEKYTTTINNSEEALLTLNSDYILKDSVNEINPALPYGIKSVETNIDAEAINGGKGAIKISTNDITLELPFSTIDFNGIEKGDFISLKQNADSQSALLNSIKSIGKIFDFNLTSYSQDGKKIKDMHEFKSGEAKISVKLTNEEVQNLDINKLSAFYYNENTKLWENVGGSYDKKNNTFTFTIKHFSKYTIGQINESLPKTGSAINFLSLIVLALVFIIAGSSYIIIKPKYHN